MPVGGHRAAQLCLRTAAPARITNPRPVHLQARPATQLYPTTPALSSRFASPCSTRFFAISERRSVDRPKHQDPVVVAASASTSPAPPTQPTLDTAATHTPKPPRRRRRGVYYSAVFLLVGMSLGTLIRLSLAPPPPYPPGSPQDQYHVEKIREQGLALPLVRELSADPSWTSWDAYSGIQSESRARSRLTSGPLGGSHGLPFQRVFRNAGTRELVSVVYLGAATAGWPGVVHGGALATLLDESLVRCAALLFPSRTGVTARLELSYRAPTLTSGFYVVRVRPWVRDGDDPAKSDRKMWVEGTLETLHGKVCVEAKALAVVPKSVKLSPLAEGF